MYLNGRIWSLSSPLDLLRFRALSLRDRVRLGRFDGTRSSRRGLARDRAPEHCRVARAALRPARLRTQVWQPLVSAKFGKYADEVSAVWMWKKLVLRGSTRRAAGGEQLSYFTGGFGRLAAAMGRDIESNGGTIRVGTRSAERDRR